MKQESMTTRTGPKLKFPDPKNCSANKPAVLCPSERVLGLYNQENNPEAKRISKKVKKWFYDEAHNHGWNGIHFLPDVQTNHGAGCLLWKNLEAPTIKIQQNTIIFTDSSGQDE